MCAFFTFFTFSYFCVYVDIFLIQIKPNIKNLVKIQYYTAGIEIDLST